MPSRKWFLYPIVLFVLLGLLDSDVGVMSAVVYYQALLLYCFFAFMFKAIRLVWRS